MLFTDQRQRLLWRAAPEVTIARGGRFVGRFLALGSIQQENGGAIRVA